MTDIQNEWEERRKRGIQNDIEKLCETYSKQCVETPGYQSYRWDNQNSAMLKQLI